METICFPHSRKRSEFTHPLSETLTVVIVGAPNSQSALSPFALSMMSMGLFPRRR
uniref:Uncharacterized protein n=1 Tax=Anguilla anguilla TaxID=7936 RepID=A0A0E9PRU9_ANGAN